MSYVIQNFYYLNRHVVITPRFKILLILRNLERILIFYKINLFLLATKNFYILPLNHFVIFYKIFFYSQLVSILQNINLRLVGGYTTNFKKSLVWYNLRILEFSEQTSPKSLTLCIPHAQLLGNLYFLS